MTQLPRAKIKSFLYDSFILLGLDSFASDTLGIIREDTLKNLLLFVLREARDRHLMATYDKAEEIAYLYF